MDIEKVLNSDMRFKGFSHDFHLTIHIKALTIVTDFFPATENQQMEKKGTFRTRKIVNNQDIFFHNFIYLFYM